MPNITTFDTNVPYIYLSVFVTSAHGKLHEFDAIFDTGAPRTEFSDRALQYAGFFDTTENVPIPTGQQTKKYNHLVLPRIQICGHTVVELDVFVSNFEKSWGIDALVGLDFLRRFKVEIDYSLGLLLTEPLACGRDR